MAGERKFITENVRRVLLKEYLKEQVKRAGFGGVDIQRTPMGTRVTLITERPGLVIGRKGSSIKALTDAIEFDYHFDKPQVEVVEVDNANLSAQIMAEKLASALERGWHFRRAGHSTVRRVMENGARGCQVIIAGKLTGQRHRTEKFKDGHIKFCGEPKLQWMEEGYTAAKLKQGVIGCKVQIMHPKAKLPDEVEIKDLGIKPPPPTYPDEKPSDEAVADKPDTPVKDEDKKAEKEDRPKKKGKKDRAEKKPKPEEAPAEKDVPSEKEDVPEPAEEKTAPKKEEKAKPKEEPKPETRPETKPEVKKKSKEDVSDLIVEKEPSVEGETKEEKEDGPAKDE